MTRKVANRVVTPFAVRLRRYRLNTAYGEYTTGRKKGQPKPLSVEMLASLTGIPKSSISRWENGTQLPGPRSLRLLARIFYSHLPDKDAEDSMYIDCLLLAPDMLEFLTTTVEGNQVVRNVRKVMQVMEKNGKLPQRRNIPEGDRFNLPFLKQIINVETRTRAKREREAQDTPLDP